MAGSQYHTRNELAEWCGMLLNKEVIENKFFFGVADIRYVGKGPLENLGIEVNFDFALVGYVWGRRHNADEKDRLTA